MRERSASEEEVSSRARDGARCDGVRADGDRDGDARPPRSTSRVQSRASRRSSCGSCSRISARSRIYLGSAPPAARGRGGARAERAGADALWVELVRLAWQEESPGLLPAGGSWREFFRQMRQPPAIMTRGPKVPAECESLWRCPTTSALWCGKREHAAWSPRVPTADRGDRPGRRQCTHQLARSPLRGCSPNTLGPIERASAVRTGAPWCACRTTSFWRGCASNGAGAASASALCLRSNRDCRSNRPPCPCSSVRGGCRP